MTVTACSSSPHRCQPPNGDASADVSYFVVFGSGRGEIRLHGQAMTDLYEELRNRTAFGERLDAEPRDPGDAGAATAARGRTRTKESEGSSDPLAQCAFHLLDLVDDVGEVTLDIVHGQGSSGCLVWLRRSNDGGASECLVQEPERLQRPGRKAH
jgi:hypothetical protein